MSGKSSSLLVISAFVVVAVGGLMVGKYHGSGYHGESMSSNMQLKIAQNLDKISPKSALEVAQMLPQSLAQKMPILTSELYKRAALGDNYKVPERPEYHSCISKIKGVINVSDEVEDKQLMKVLNPKAIKATEELKQIKESINDISDNGVMRTDMIVDLQEKVEKLENQK